MSPGNDYIIRVKATDGVVVLYNDYLIPYQSARGFWVYSV